MLLLNTAAQTALWRSAYAPCVQAYNDQWRLAGETFDARTLLTDGAALEWMVSAPCQQRLASWSSAVTVASFVIVAFVTFAVFWFMPTWRLRRLVRVHASSKSELYQELEDLRTQCRLPVRPRYVIAPGVPTKTALVFGRPGLLVLCLNNGLVKMLREEPVAFRTVVLHEFAHLRNKDVTLAYATVSLWRVWLALVVLPCAVQWAWENWTDSPYWALHYGGRGTAVLAVAIVVVARFTRAEVLRNRELCADLDAYRWGADLSLWQRAAAAERRALGPVRRWWRHLWRFHPHWQRRYEVLHQLEKGFRFYRWYPSVATSFAFLGCFILMPAVLTSPQFPLLWGPAHRILFYGTITVILVTFGSAVPEKTGSSLPSRPERLLWRRRTIVLLCAVVVALSFLVSYPDGT
ncbi:M48 family metalloprotease [Streptomyces sp. TG1A-8]|uniref:M48 family metalloprotease n=1 Tax=Streptomyces sp. TG1A-8 TaxID=3051385 RepID=UPI00265B939D|nr:M48 family metalloprotease [Streptomyces sp. TG1A-8]MDO0929855.1 M48 family metalloprotease [Streptomyces sp. TG1A-8]